MQVGKAIAGLLLCVIASLALSGCGRRSQLVLPEREAAPEVKRLPAQADGSRPEELDIDGVRGQKKQFILDSLL